MIKAKRKRHQASYKAQAGLDVKCWMLLGARIGHSSLNIESIRPLLALTAIPEERGPHDRRGNQVVVLAHYVAKRLGTKEATLRLVAIRWTNML